MRTWMATVSVCTATAALLTLAGCGGPRNSSHGGNGLGLGGPRGHMEATAGVTVCGTQLAEPSVLQPVLFDISRGRRAGPVLVGSLDDVVLVRTSDSCDRGADVSIDPPGAMAITKVAPARDGKPAAVALNVRQLIPTSVSVSTGGILTIALTRQ